MANQHYLYNTWEFFVSFHCFRDIAYHYIYKKKCMTLKAGKDHDVQHSQWRHSIASIILYKSRTWAVFAGFNCFQAIANIYIFRIFVSLKI